MISIDIPGFRKLKLRHLVLDYNGTLARDGRLLPGVARMLAELATDIHIHVITADTFGEARKQLARLPVDVVIIPTRSQAEAKLKFLSKLGARTAVAVGNGRNDRKMLKAAALGVALVQTEGGAVETIASADVVSANILDA
ncbi:MAG: HAD family hydrolase, partial [Chloroflexota bacterium]